MVTVLITQSESIVMLDGSLSSSLIFSFTKWNNASSSLLIGREVIYVAEHTCPLVKNTVRCEDMLASKAAFGNIFGVPLF